MASLKVIMIIFYKYIIKHILFFIKLPHLKILYYYFFIFLFRVVNWANQLVSIWHSVQLELESYEFSLSKAVFDSNLTWYYILII